MFLLLGGISLMVGKLGLIFFFLLVVLSSFLCLSGFWGCFFMLWKIDCFCGMVIVLFFVEGWWRKVSRVDLCFLFVLFVDVDMEEEVFIGGNFDKGEFFMLIVDCRI